MPVTLNVEVDEAVARTKNGVKTLTVTVKMTTPNGMIYLMPIPIENPSADDLTLQDAKTATLTLAATSTASTAPAPTA